MEEEVVLNQQDTLQSEEKAKQENICTNKIGATGNQSINQEEKNAF